MAIALSCPDAVLFNHDPQSAGLEKHSTVPKFTDNVSTPKDGGWLSRSSPPKAVGPEQQKIAE